MSSTSPQQETEAHPELRTALPSNAQAATVPTAYLSLIHI